MGNLSTSSEIERPRFNQAWRDQQHGTLHATVTFGVGSSWLTIDSTAEAVQLAAAAITAAAAIDRLEAEPGLEILKTAELAGVLQAAAAAVADVLKAARLWPTSTMMTRKRSSSPTNPITSMTRTRTASKRVTTITTRNATTTRDFSSAGILTAGTVAGASVPAIATITRPTTFGPTRPEASYGMGD